MVRIISVWWSVVHIWEVGCRKDYHCEGGAVCVDEQCACPTGYRSVAGNTKCAKIGGRHCAFNTTFLR